METDAGMGVDLVEVVPSGDDPAGWSKRRVRRVLPRLAEVG
jgi:hypothetical protein